MGATNPINLIETGLRAMSFRGKVIANNLVNFDTPSFRRNDVSFTKVMAEAVASGQVVDLDKVPPEIYKPMTTQVDDRGNDVDMDFEVGELIKNSARYRTSMRLLTKLYNQMGAAMSDRS